MCLAGLMGVSAAGTGMPEIPDTVPAEFRKISEWDTQPAGNHH